MANYCNYEVRVKGSKNACRMVYASMPFLDSNDMEWERKEGNSYHSCFTGNCKWSVNFGVNDELKKVNVDSMSEAEIEKTGTNYSSYSLRAKSDAFRCEIMVHYWSEESGFDQFDHYKDGRVLKRRKIEFNYENQTVFDWKRLEFEGHEGEYDESVDGEQQNEQFMAMLSALGGSPTKQSSEISDDNQELNDIGEGLLDLLSQLEDMAAESGIDLNNASIGDTGFDLYNWTFSEGKRKSVKGWSIAIPDGFTVIESKEDRLFEAVPSGMENCASIPVHILPGIGQASDAIPEDMWTYHPYARAGVAEILAVSTSEAMANILGDAPEILSTAFSDICAYILVQDTGGKSYSYLSSIFTEGKVQQLRVQTKRITDEQKKRLADSIIAWVETFRFNEANPSVPKEAMLSSTKVFDELKRGKTASFEKAVDSAYNECNLTVTGKLKTLQYHAEYGLLNEGENIQDPVRKILTRGMEVMEFYYLRADQLVEKLKTLSLKASIMDMVYKKLDELKDAIPPCAVDGKQITVSLPKKVKDIQSKWTKESNELQRKIKAEEKERREEELRLQKAAQEKHEEELRKYNEAHKKWERKCADIETKRSAFVEAKIEEQKAKIINTAMKSRDEAIKKGQSKLKKQEKRKANAESTLASLGVFKFAEKKAQKSIIEEATNLIKEAQASISAAETTYSQKISEADKKAAQKHSTYEKDAEKEFPFPVEPSEPR